MSPMPQPRGGKVSPPSNLYTAILAVAVAVVLCTSPMPVIASTERFSACRSRILSGGTRIDGQSPAVVPTVTSSSTLRVRRLYQGR